MSVVVVQGASRGLGLALTRALLANTNLKVVATCRNPSTATHNITSELTPNQIARLKILQLDVTDENTISSASKFVKDTFGPTSVRLLLNISGILVNPEKALKQVSANILLENFKVNSIGPLLVAKHFVPLLQTKFEGKEDQDKEPQNYRFPNFAVIGNVSAKTGSISDNHLGGWYAYRASKAALNQFTRTLAIELAYRNIDAVAVTLHPGTVKTDLSSMFVKNVSPEKLFTPHQSASYLLDVIRGLKKADSGKLISWNGEVIPY
ncbi:hypothetical protein G9A89_020874 [Geosiphon pyriformis]|nr:hypothetical protein G9A89_020874 [Geosiphon pyriformis]